MHLDHAELLVVFFIIHFQNDRPECFIIGNPDAKSWNYKDIKYCELCHKATWMSMLIPGGLIFFSFTLT